MPASPYEIWQVSIPLSEAWLELIDHFWPEKERAALYSILLQPALPGEFEGQSGMTWDHYNPKDYAARLRIRDSLPLKFADEVFHFIHSGSLHAFGKPWLPEARDEYVAVPPEMFLWNSDVEPIWEADQISSMGRSYVQVRVASPQMIAELEGIAPGSGGRTSFRPEIGKAVRHYLAQNSAWHKLRRKVRREDIIRYCQEKFAHVERGRKPTGFSLTICDEVISEILRELRLQASRKLPS